MVDHLSRMEVEDDDEGTRDMMGAIDEVVRHREEKQARLASLRAEAEELRGAIQSTFFHLRHKSRNLSQVMFRVLRCD